jgi:hypothetical protein
VTPSASGGEQHRQVRSDTFKFRSRVTPSDAERHLQVWNDTFFERLKIKSREILGREFSNDDFTMKIEFSVGV